MSAAILVRSVMVQASPLRPPSLHSVKLNGQFAINFTAAKTFRSCLAGSVHTPTQSLGFRRLAGTARNKKVERVAVPKHPFAVARPRGGGGSAVPGADRRRPLESIPHPADPGAPARRRRSPGHRG